MIDGLDKFWQDYTDIQSPKDQKAIARFRAKNPDSLYTDHWKWERKNPLERHPPSKNLSCEYYDG